MENSEEYRFDPFPDDGDWSTSDWFMEVAPEHAGPAAVAEAVAALRPLFPPGEVHGLPYNGGMPHPFAWDYCQRGSIRHILTLGRCLSIIGSPRELVGDLAHPARYATRFGEAWAGALFVRLGARIRYIDERQRGMKPEFVAAFGDGDECELAVEVKELNDGDKRQRLIRITTAFQKGIWDAQMDVSREGHAPSRADVQPPLRRLEDLALDGAEPKLDEGRALGFAIGLEWMRFLDGQPAVGRHEVGDHLRIEILPEEERASGGQTMMPTPSLPKRTDFMRLRRGPLASSAKKFRAFGLPGVLVIGRPHVGLWDPDDLGKLDSELRRPASWASSVAAILLRYESFDGGRRRDMVRLMPGPLAQRLPPGLLEFFSPCARCGKRHREIDFLRDWGQAGGRPEGRPKASGKPVAPVP